MRIVRVALPLALALAVAACDRPAHPVDETAGEPAVPAAAAFTYAATSDVSGYYISSSEIRIGKWVLDDLFIGQDTEFGEWTGADKAATFAPIMVEFSDATSPMVEVEMGPTRSIKARVLPTRYAVSDDRIEFEGTAPELGAVRFEGRIDQGALATSRRNLGDDGTVVTGTLTAAGQTLRDVKLRWWMGD